MPVLDHVIGVLKFNMAFARKLIEDVPEEKMAVQPMPGMNHAAWIIGHISMPRLWMKDLLKLDTNVPPDWVEKFNMGSKVTNDRAAYPTKAELLAALKETEDKLAPALAKLTEDDLAKPTDERMRAIFPTVGILLTGLICSHQAFHQGQLSAWRRAMGMGQVRLL